jgi:TolB-like protein/Flp pilus assembly protein TadD
LQYEFLGEQEVKNIERPVRVYRVLSFPGAAAHRVVRAKTATAKKWRKVVLAMAVILVIGAAVGTIWNLYFRPSVEPASMEKMAFKLPDKPSIAVLPFVNMSGDPEQEYFSDGMTEDLITDLSQISGLFVIGRNSTFAYKGKTIKIGQVAEELGVRYVLEGSVRKANNRVRINAQLIDATTGHHLWAKRYDGKLGDIFDLQDKINQKIVSALKVKFTAGEQERVTKKETDNIAAYDAFLKGWKHYDRFTRKDLNKAHSYFKKAIDLDPHYGRAYAALGSLYFWSGRSGVMLDVPLSDSYKQASKYLQMAMKYPTSLAHWLASQLALVYKEYEKAIAEAERAIAIGPNEPVNHFQMADALIFAGRPGEAFNFIKRAKRLNPQRQYLYITGLAHFAIGEDEEAVILLERIHTRATWMKKGHLVPLAAAYAHLDRDQEAQAALSKYQKHFPHSYSMGYYLYYWPFKEGEVADRFVEGLRKAGVPY